VQWKARAGLRVLTDDDFVFAAELAQPE
jgi:hypothetical protein